MNYGYLTEDHTYIGDGVYVRDIGGITGMLEIAANSPITDIIYLEDAVMVALINYWKRSRGLTTDKENEDAAL